MHVCAQRQLQYKIILHPSEETVRESRSALHAARIKTQVWNGTIRELEQALEYHILI